MKDAYLTIDDCPSPLFIEKLNFLLSKNVPAVLFCQGNFIEKYSDDVVYAIKKGFIVANHSYSHANFFEHSIDECKEEIQKTEVLVNEAYRKAGIQRPIKLFRFPYGHRRDDLQEFLSVLGYVYLPDEAIAVDSYVREFKKTDSDVFWTLDTKDWKNEPLSIVYKRIDDNAEAHPLRTEIVLIHDHEPTHENFFKIVQKMLDSGFVFKLPDIND